MALLKDLLNRTRLGESIDTYKPETTDYYPKTPQVTEGKDLTDCPSGYRWDSSLRKCVRDMGDRDEQQCPSGYHFEPHLGICVPDKADEPTPPPTPTPPQWFTCPDGRRVSDLSECDEEKEVAPEPFTPDKPDNGDDKPCVDTTWSPSTNTVGIGQSFTQTSNCGRTRQATGTKEIDPTPDPDPIDEEVGGHREYIEDEGGDIGDFYDRYPIDYDPSRFGDYQKWLKPRYDEEGKLISGTLPKEDLFERLGIKLKEEYKEFFPDYSWFPESLAGTQFDVGRKGMTADLFDLTRQSWQLRKGQGLLSGAPREFERLGMGQTGREFQAMDVAYRKDIYGMRKGFEEETINRLLDLMKAKADPTYARSDTPDQFEEAKNTGDWVIDDNGKSWQWDGTQWIDRMGNPGDPQINIGDTG